MKFGFGYGCNTKTRPTALVSVLIGKIHLGCGLPNSFVVGSKVEAFGTFDTAFYKIWNTIGDICERTCCDNVLVYVTNTSL